MVVAHGGHQLLDRQLSQVVVWGPPAYLRSSALVFALSLQWSSTQRAVGHDLLHSSKITCVCGLSVQPPQISC